MAKFRFTESTRNVAKYCRWDKANRHSSCHSSTIQLSASACVISILYAQLSVTLYSRQLLRQPCGEINYTARRECEHSACTLRSILRRSLAGLSLRRAGFDHQAVRVAVVVDKLVMEQVFIQVLRFISVVSFHKCSKFVYNPTEGR